MSVDPTTLERSALERKDREELTTIAQALGAKPPSPRPQGRDRAAHPRADGCGVRVVGCRGGGIQAQAHPCRQRRVATGGHRGRIGQRHRHHHHRRRRPRLPSPRAATNRPQSGRTQPPTRAGRAPDPGPPPTTTTDPVGRTGRTTPPAPSATERGGSTVTATEGDVRGGGRAGRAADGRQREPERSREQQRGDGQQVDVNEPGNRRRRRRGAARWRRDPRRGVTPASPWTSRACSTCATRATASCACKGSLPSKDDVYVSVKQARQFGLRKGDHIKGGQPSCDAQREEPGAAPHRLRQRRATPTRPASGGASRT